MISISNLTVVASAPIGTVVGVATAFDAALPVTCNWILTPATAGFFTVDEGGSVTTLWDEPIAPGYYGVQIRSVGVTQWFSERASFAIQVTAA
jgi:hypothetical protein